MLATEPEQADGDAHVTLPPVVDTRDRETALAAERVRLAADVER